MQLSFTASLFNRLPQYKDPYLANLASRAVALFLPVQHSSRFSRARFRWLVSQMCTGLMFDRSCATSDGETVQDTFSHTNPFLAAAVFTRAFWIPQQRASYVLGVSDILLPPRRSLHRSQMLRSLGWRGPLGREKAGRASAYAPCSSLHDTNAE